MKILLPFNQKGKSQALVASAFAKYKNNPIEDIEVEIFNLSNRNIKKYLRKKRDEEISGVQNSVPRIIYVYEKEKELIDFLLKEYPSISVITYNDNLAYKPQRVPGNELPTVAYFLYDKIIYDIYSCYKRYEVYYINSFNLSIETKEIGELELKHPYSKVILRGELFFRTEDEAIVALNQEINRKVLYKTEIMQQKVKELEYLQKQIYDLQEEIIKLNLKII